MLKRKSSWKLKIVSSCFVIAAFLATVYYGHQKIVYYQELEHQLNECQVFLQNTQKKLGKIEELYSDLNSNKLFQECMQHWRKRRFIQKGGEYLPNYDHPRTLNDKIAYVLEKYFMNSPITEIIEDKYYVKQYIASKVDSKYNVRLLGVWDNPEDIKWDKLPDTFVLKATRGHYGEQVILVRDKSKLDKAETIKKLQEFCNLPYMLNKKKKRIIAEEMLDPGPGKSLIDYKIYCSYGRAFLAYCLGMAPNSSNAFCREKTSSYYSVPDWKRLPLQSGEHKPNYIHKPRHFAAMLQVAERLSKDFPLIRIDFYEIGDHIKVGEITEDSNGATAILKPVEWDFTLGNLVKVPSQEEIDKLIERDHKLCRNFVR